MSEWQLITWGDIATLEYGKTLKGYRNSKGTVPVYGTNGPIGFTDEPLFDGAGVIIGRKGAYRGVHYSDKPFFVIDTAFYLKPRHGVEFDTLFSYYQLLTKNINAMDSGSAIPSTSREDFYNLEVDLPTIGEQKAIAEILFSLDEKIELNRKQNRTLEAIGQALFKRCFVEFEFPDENGQPYKSSGGAMQPSELGEIPVGWAVGKLEEIIGELETGSRPKGGVGRFIDGVPSIGAESITRIGEFDYSKTKFVPEEYFAKMRRGTIKDRDVLIYKDGGQPGRFDARISMFGGGFPYGTACLNEHVFRLQAKSPVYQNYLYLWFSSYLILEELRFRGAKAAIPGINTADVKELEFLFIDEGVLEKFDEVIESLFLMLLHNSREMAVLSNLRDTLLPKFMSGELRVGNRSSKLESEV